MGDKNGLYGKRDDKLIIRGTCGTQSRATTGTALFVHVRLLAGVRPVGSVGASSRGYTPHGRVPVRAFARARPHPRH